VEGLCYVHVRLRGGERCEDKEGGLRLGGGDGWEDLWCTVVAELVLKMVLC